ncbi:MAG: glycosyltransferase family 2 protein [Alphaproteobacteria bacterium]|nr:glycosyltransferase family 2 protein [Alphaproteobacteria bacterium]MBN2675595.1 glycosyltransferase family 2 protein [Alphaproteobacteria bacterium]
MNKRIAAITMARNDEFFLNRWIAYYGRELGQENLYIYLDGIDQKIPSGAGQANITKLPHNEGLSRAQGDKYRISLMSNLAKGLFANGYDIVIGCDVDEFLIVDPDVKKSLAGYLSEQKINTSVSGLGMDVGQDLNSEYVLDIDKPFLEQRSFALLSTRYTKPVVLAKPAKWGSGFHCVKKHNFHTDKNLYLLHFGSVDYEMIRTKVGDRNPDWKKHLYRRAETIYIITRKKNRSESFIKLARTLQTLVRPIYAWNKPAQFGLKLVTKIPKRFKKTGI